MAKVHGKGTAISLGGDDLSAFGTSVSWSREADTHDVTTFGKNSKVYQGGLKDGTATLEGIYDSTATTGPAAVIEALIGTTTEFVYQPEGLGSGKPTKTVDVVVSSYEETAPVAEMITFSCELQMSDDVAITSQSA